MILYVIIPEAVLHLLALAGGTIGAIAGQLTFHHKTKKLSFRVIYIIIVIVQISTGGILSGKTYLPFGCPNPQGEAQKWGKGKQDIFSQKKNKYLPYPFYQ